MWIAEVKNNVGSKILQRRRVMMPTDI